jgi:hypothetical protein
MRRANRDTALRSPALPRLLRGLRCNLGLSAIGNGWIAGPIRTRDSLVTEVQFLSASIPDRRVQLHGNLVYACFGCQKW